ncbi:hypothetical protein L4C54_15980 [Vibrio lamellibrachiae]|uniref:hypothetical protein n=1 Tax=Vibrio lamellibrachiae TaxID=2910253 RepID=UPI003D0D2AB6
MDIRKALMSLSVLLLVAGCSDSDSVGNNGGNNANVKIKTQNAAAFAMTDSSTGELQVLDSSVMYTSSSCLDFVRAIEEGHINVPNALAPVFEFPNDVGNIDCTVNSVVATPDNLYLQGDFLNFSLAPEIGEDELDPEDVAPVNMSCNILKIPMYDSGRQGEVAECLSERIVGDFEWRHNSAIALDRNTDTLYFTEYAGDASQGDATLYSHNENYGLVEVLANIEFSNVGNRHEVILSEDGQTALVKHGGLTYINLVTGSYESFGYDWNGCYIPDHMEYGCNDWEGDTISSRVDAQHFGDTVVTGLFKDGGSNLVFDLSNGTYGELKLPHPLRIRYGDNRPPLVYGDRVNGRIFSQGVHCLADPSVSCLSELDVDTLEFNRTGHEGGAFSEVQSDGNIYFYFHACGDTTCGQSGSGQFGIPLHVWDVGSDYVDHRDLTSKLVTDFPDMIQSQVIGSWVGGAVLLLTDPLGKTETVYMNHRNDYELYEGESATGLVNYYQIH